MGLIVIVSVVVNEAWCCQGAAWGDACR